MEGRVRRRALIWVLVAYLFLGTWHSVLNPICESSDEYWHLGFVVHLAQGGALPVQQPGRETSWRQEGSQPPLYYWLQAQIARGLGLPLERLDAACPRNPHANLGDATQIANRNLALHGPWQAFPWSGMVLTIHVWRFVSVLLGALAVWGAAWLARELFPSRPGWAVAVAAFVAFNPMFLFINSAVSNDALITPLATLVLALSARVWKRGTTYKGVLLLGGLSAMAALTKLSGLTLWPWAALALLFSAEAGTRRWRYLALFLLLLFVGSGWWFWRNWQLYHDPTGLNVMLDIVGRRHASLQDLLREGEGFRRAFWGVFGGMNVLMPGWVYALLDGWTLVVGIGWLAFLFSRWRRKVLDRQTWGAIVGYIATVFVALVRWTMKTLASQGRLMFPALAPIGLIWWAGWEWWAQRWPHRWLRVGTAWTPLAFLALLGFLAPPLWIAPVYNPDRVRVESLPSDVERAEVAFDDVVRLLGYRLPQASTVHPGEDVDIRLYFERLEGTTRPWSLFVHLVDDVGIILAQEDRYPFLGLLDMPRVPPHARWEEPVRLHIPETAVTPARLHMEMGFYDLKTMERLPPAGLGEDHVSLGSWVLQSNPGPYPNPSFFVFGDRIALVGFDIHPRRLRPGDTLQITLYWQCLASMNHDYVVFTHVLEPPQRIWGQQDKAPRVPTHAWEVGKVYAETYTLHLKEDTPPGLYEIEIGWYRPDTGKRLRLPDGRNFLYLSRVRVVP